MKRLTGIIIATLLLLSFFLAVPPVFAGDVTQGTLRAMDSKGKPLGECPLKHTDVQADISGFISRVRVTQEFHNPYKTPIEAVYIFPLPQNSAVDSMVMKIGDRTIRGIIKEKEEARKIYENAKKHGQRTALLDQERPNIFTQSVANIMPGDTIKIEISYVDVLDYTDGTYEFVFPMVVGPRYMSGTPTGKKGTGSSPDTTKVPDGTKISPRVTEEGTRAGHDINVTVNLDAGVRLQKVSSVLHKVNIQYEKDLRNAKITLKQDDRIPNKDFILQYETAGDKIEDAVMTYAKNGEGYFTFILQPPKKPEVSTITPKEMYFVIDSSGSQSGWPIEKAKETMKYCIENMNPNDTFQLLSFSNHVTPCFNKPMPNTKANREKAQRWLANQMGRGGTELMKAIDYSLGAEPDPERMRIVVFMTDGYVGSDMTILGEIKKKLGNARIFSFGVGNSVNRYLLEGMAKMGKGEVEWVTLNRHGDEVAEAFQEKIGNPLLLDIKVDWNGAPVKDVYPREIPDLFSGKPVILKGRYTKAWNGVITLKGKQSNKPYERKIHVNFPGSNSRNDVLGVLWARTKIADLMNNDLKGVQAGQPNKEIKQMIIDLGLKFKLMTQFTSFVAVEDKVVNKDGKNVTVPVPVEMPDGVSYQGVFGEDRDEEKEAFGGGGSGRGSVMTSNQPVKAYRIRRKPSAPPPPSKPVSTVSSGYAPMPEEDKADNYLDTKAKAVDKLDKSLLNLAEKVHKEGKNGNLKLSTFEVKKGKVGLILTVTHVSDKVLEALKTKGFTMHSCSKTQKLIRGSINVKNLESLVKLNFVTMVEPLPTPVREIEKSLKSKLNLDDFIARLSEILNLN